MGAVVSGITAASLALNPMPAHATLEDAAVKVADTSYPIISKLQKKQVAPVLSKAIGAALNGDPVAALKIVKAADEALISTDPAKLVAALKAVDVALDHALAEKGVIPPLADVENWQMQPVPRWGQQTKQKLKRFSTHSWTPLQP